MAKGDCSSTTPKVFTILIPMRMELIGLANEWPWCTLVAISFFFNLLGNPMCIGFRYIPFTKVYFYQKKNFNVAKPSTHEGNVIKVSFFFH
jgi:hypothetical protein